MDSYDRGRMRQFAFKARGGCQTCRRRHVRCSQERPVCTTCANSRRQCSYDRSKRSSPGDELKIVQWKPRDNSPRRSPSATNWPSEEMCFLQHFQEICCVQLMGSFDDMFWNRTIYQISETTAAVRHAIIAVSMSWKRLGVLPGSNQPAELDSEKGLRHYLSAVSHVRALSENRQGSSMHDILVCNVLFLCLELCQGDYESAMRQMSSCLDVFCDWMRDSRVMDQSNEHLGEVEQNLVKVFRKMLAQAVLFIDTHAIVPRIFEPESGIDSCDIPQDFDSAERARDCLHTVISALIHQSITRRMAERNVVGGDQEVSRPMFRLGSQELEQFSVAFDRLREHSHLPSRKRKMQEAAIKAQLLSVKVLAAVSMSDESEWAFDQHLLVFESILEECFKVAELLSVSTAWVFSFDMEILPPLYLVAARCRDPHIRRQAVRLLRTCNRQEGPWNGAMLAAIVGRIIVCEEEGLCRSHQNTVADVRCRLTLTDALIDSRHRVVKATFARRQDSDQEIRVQVDEITY